MRVLITGMSGAGKSTVMRELASRGYETTDVDDPALGLTFPRHDGEVGWNVEAIRTLLNRTTASPIFVAGCSEEQAELLFDFTVLLSAPPETLRERLTSRAGNDYGKSPQQLAAVLNYVETVEPLLRCSADLEIVTTIEVERVADIILEHVS